MLIENIPNYYKVKWSCTVRIPDINVGNSQVRKNNDYNSILHCNMEVIENDNWWTCSFVWRFFTVKGIVDNLDKVVLCPGQINDDKNQNIPNLATFFKNTDF